MPIFRTPYTGLLNIPGCVLWLDGKDPNGTRVTPSTGATVSTWVDKSVSAKHGASTGTPTYVAGGGVNFDGSSYFLNQTFSQNLSQRSIFIVFQETTNTQFAGVLTIIPTPNSGNDQSTTNGLSSETTTNTLVFNGNFPGYQSQIGSGNPLPKGIYYDSMNGTAGSGYFNGTNATNVTASYTAGTCSGYGLGGRWQGGSMSALYRLNGVIYEILFFNTTLSTRNRQQVEGYLAQKWGLEANLPAGSPGRTQVIYPHTLRLNSLTTGQPTRLPLIRPLRVSVITPGSVFHLDAGNPTSYPGSGSTWTDLAGSGLTTTLFGSPTYSSANGGYLSFAPASSQYGQTSASLSALTRWTVEIWHYYSATNGSGNPCILSEVWNSTPINFTIGSAAFGGNTTLQAAYFNSVWYYTASNYSLPSVGWYQIVGTYDGTNIKLYINNVLTQTQASAGTPASSGLGIRLMRRWDLGNYWGGRLAIVRIYNRALLASEVTTNYADSKARFGLS